MTPTPPSTASGSAGGNSPTDGQSQYRVVRKRNRVPLSCTPCRHRKLKCNRSNPCENCIRRGDASSCSYAPPGTRKKNQTQGPTTPDDMQNRIDRLEGLVLSLMTNGAQSAGPAAAVAAISRSQSDSTTSTGYPLDLDQDQEDDEMIKEEDEGDESDVDRVTNSLGILKVDPDKGKSLYFGGSHWHMVLADIAEVKSYFSNHKKELESNYEKIKQSKARSAKDGPAFLFGGHVIITDAELRAELPSKSTVEKLVSRYMNSDDPTVQVIHSPTFHKLLQVHWQDPSKTSIVWLGLLYATLCLAMQSYHRIGDEPLEWKDRTLDMAAEFKLRTVQCLVNSDYTKSDMYTIETLILYVFSEYNSKWDAEVGIWVIVGMIVRLAMRMGYHRDPSKYSGLTPYQMEMRRRIWTAIHSMDTMFSFQLALPSMIRSSDCDAALPRNIFEDEFGPESVVLPPARPVTEPTPASYMITKAQISFEFGGIIEEVNAVVGKGVSYDDILKRDNRLREIKTNMAPHLRLRPMDECTHDPAVLLMQRYNIDIFLQKCICVLHRKYIARARQNPRYAHSRRACVDASMEILHHQASLYRESQPGGRLRSMKWFIHSLTKHDFLLAAMIVCLDLHYDAIAETQPVLPPHYNRCFWTVAQKADMMAALEKSRAIWKESMHESMEAYKGAQILELILEKIKVTNSRPVSVEKTTTAEAFAQFDDESVGPEHSAAVTLGMLSGGLTPNTAAMFGNVASNSPAGARYGGMDVSMGVSSGTGLTPYQMDGANPYAASFSAFGNVNPGTGMMDVPASLDWEAWDQYIQNNNAIDVDPAFQFYPTVMDPNLSPGGGMSEGYGNNIFMGANTPGR